MEKSAYDKALCELFGTQGPAGFTHNQQDGTMVEVWQAPNRRYFHLVPSDRMTDEQRADMFTLLAEQLRNG